MSKKLLIIVLIVAIVVGGTTVGFFWWQKSGEKRIEEQIEEQTKPESVREVVIPSSLDPKDVVENVIVLPYYFDLISKEEDPSLKEFWERYFGIPSSGKGIIKFGGGTWMKNYSKRDGTKVHEISEEAPFILWLHVLKYGKAEFAQEDYTKIIFNQKFKVSTLEGIKLRTKVGMPPPIEEELSQYIKPEQFQQYLLHSNNFIIYVFGLKEAAEDIMIRIIEQYAVE